MDHSLLFEFMRDPESPFMRFTVDQLDRMIDAGVFTEIEDERYELLNGFLILKDTAGIDREHSKRTIRYHAIVDGLCNRMTTLVSESEFVVRCKSPIRVNSNFTPTPELTVVRGRCGDFINDFPQSGVIELIVEAELSWIARGRRIEKDQYARAGVPNYWLIDLRQPRVEVYQSPDRERGEYTKCLTLKQDEVVQLCLPGLDAVSFSVNQILNAAI